VNDLLKKMFPSEDRVPNFDHWNMVDEPPSYQPFGAKILKGSRRYRTFVRKYGSPNRKVMREILTAEYSLPVNASIVTSWNRK
jgi:hypothetical protein